MKISVVRAESGAVSLTFGETVVALDPADTRTLLVELTKALRADGSLSPTAPQQAADLAARIKAGNDIGIQKLLRVADHDDLLVLLKYTEEDGPLYDKIFGNMTEKSQKIFREDLSYRFREGVAESELGKTINRLAVIAHELEEEGTLTCVPG